MLPRIHPATRDTHTDADGHNTHSQIRMHTHGHIHTDTYTRTFEEPASDPLMTCFVGEPLSLEVLHHTLLPSSFPIEGGGNSTVELRSSSCEGVPCHSLLAFSFPNNLQNLCISRTRQRATLPGERSTE
eukprot:GHVU01077223.1.p3 GENE.GHVU01077223.1~~GHVU01077223.1.p3  ORF type:complete len:129 (+),score=7.20 GHVU01077223.1:428-814(+)